MRADVIGFAHHRTPFTIIQNMTHTYTEIDLVYLVPMILMWFSNILSSHLLRRMTEPSEFHSQMIFKIKRLFCNCIIDNILFSKWNDSLMYNSGGGKTHLPQR